MADLFRKRQDTKDERNVNKKETQGHKNSAETIILKYFILNSIRAQKMEKIFSKMM